VEDGDGLRGLVGGWLGIGDVRKMLDEYGTRKESSKLLVVEIDKRRMSRNANPHSVVSSRMASPDQGQLPSTSLVTM
jgi:hypothetical protein